MNKRIRDISFIFGSNILHMRLYGMIDADVQPTPKCELQVAQVVISIDSSGRLKE
jgi:hypothetical protein